METKLMNLTGLWKKKTKNGLEYLSGNLGNRINILVFVNSKKKPDSKEPDYTVCLAPYEPKEKPKAEENDFPF